MELNAIQCRLRYQSVDALLQLLLCAGVAERIVYSSMLICRIMTLCIRRLGRVAFTLTR